MSGPTFSGGLTVGLADGRYAPQIPGVILPLALAIPLGSVNLAAYAASQLHLVRVIVPKTGTLHDLAVYVGTTSGNVRAGVYDTDDASSGNRTLLWDSGTVATGTQNAWQVIGDPGLAVKAGQQLELAHTTDNTTATFLRASVQSNSTQLPANFNVVAGGASPKLGAVATLAFGALSNTISEAGCVLNSSITYLIARVS